MPVPLAYMRASAEFDAFTEALRRRLGHDTRHQTYQTVESILRVFRRRLTPAQGIAFAGVLPAVLCAIFVADWDTDAQPAPFSSREALEAEVRERRRDHDFTPPGAIAEMARVLATHVDSAAFERALSRLPLPARQFWAVR